LSVCGKFEHIPDVQFSPMCRHAWSES